MAASWLRLGPGSVDVQVRVAPRASRSRIAGVMGERLKIQVTAPPVEGQANLEVARLLAKSAGLPARNATVSAGAASRSKTIRLACDDPASVADRLERLAAQARGVR
jgi:uncharacterized protein